MKRRPLTTGIAIPSMRLAERLPYGTRVPVPQPIFADASRDGDLPPQRADRLLTDSRCRHLSYGARPFYTEHDPYKTLDAIVPL